MAVIPMPGARPLGRLSFFFERRTADHMTGKVQSVSPTVTLGDLGKLIEQFDYNAFPVMAGEKLLGIVTKFDFMHAFAFTEQRLIPDYQALMRTPVSEIMSSEVVTVRPDEPLTRVLQKMVRLKTRSFPVVEAAKLLGIISREDIIAALKESVATH